MSREDEIREATRRLADYFQPERIYLFGSAARGEAGPDSDLDFMVLLSDEAPEQLLRAGEGDFNLRGLGSVDVLIWRAREFDRWLPLKASFPATIVREGRLLHERVLTTA
jgi:predicted nucleotidyltransferase